MAEERVQRRLAAILAADVVGYSQLMERDEAATLALLKARRKQVVEPVVTQHEGRIFKVNGDGVLIEFASAVNAVQCAVQLQTSMAAANGDLPADRHIVLRIGINLGDVMVEGGDLYGDCVNIAARLEGIAEPGGICLSEDAHRQIRSKLKLSFDDLGETSLKNISEPIHAYRIVDRPLVPVAVPKRLGGTPCVAVLPFTNMTSDAEQEFFADGLTEDLITALSKEPGLFVIARHSTFAYKGKAMGIRQIARELGVSHLVEGSVRRAAGRVRISAQLIDARDGSHLWADRFDRELTDVFALQDEVVRKIIRRWRSRSRRRGHLRRRTPNIAAYDLFVRGRPLALQLPEGNLEARSLLERAIEIDPEFAEAHAWLALCLFYEWLSLGNYRDSADPRDRILAIARRAVSLDSGNADAHLVSGYILFFKGNPDTGREKIEMALRLRPNHADGLALKADIDVLDGKPEDAVVAIRKAFELNPYPPIFYFWFRALAYYAAGQYQAAVDTLDDKIVRGTGSQVTLASSLARLGRIEEARAIAADYSAAMPQFSIAQWTRLQPFRRPADLDHFIEAYRLAGLPE